MKKACYTLSIRFNKNEGDSTIFEREPLENLAKDGQLYTYQHEGFWKCMDTLRDKNQLEEIKKELESVEIPEKSIPSTSVKEDNKGKKQFRREAKDPNSIIGRGIKEEAIKIKTLIGEDNNVVVEAQVFGTDYFESSKTDFKIITLKIILLTSQL